MPDEETPKENPSAADIPDQTEPDENPEISQLLHRRKRARSEGDFQRADKIRERLRAMGVEVRDDKLAP